MNNSRRALVTSTFSGMFLWGIIASIAPLSKSWPFAANVTGYAEILLVLVGPILSLLGNASMGILSDFIGRRRVFLVTMALYFTGILVISFSESIVMLLAGIALSEFGISGEEIPTISLLAEDTGADERASIITNGMNLSNVGSAFIAGLFLIIALGNFAILVQRLAVFLSAMVLMGIMVYSRMRLPESYRWLESRGKGMEAKKVADSLGMHESRRGIPADRKPHSALSYTVLGLLALSQYLTFGLMAYIVPYYEFHGVTVSYLIFFGLLGSSVAGPFAGRMISRGRKSYSLFSFAGGLGTVVVILLLVGYLQNLAVFIPLLFVNMIFSEFAWASRTTLEPELFPTASRGRGISFVRIVPMLAYPISIYLFASFSLYQQIMTNVILWAVGLAGAMLWFFAGIETRNVDIDYKGREA